jgi:hypothetical protein
VGPEPELDAGALGGAVELVDGAKKAFWTRG